MSKGTKNILAFITLVLVIFVFQDQIKKGFSVAKKEFFPCKEPITYSINIFDERFGISRESFLSALVQAEAIWEKNLSLNLFEHDLNGVLDVNLVFDSRQEATEKLQEIGGSIDSDKEKYDALKKEYETLRSEYLKLKEEVEGDIEDFEKRKAVFEKEAQFWNKQGGAPREKYEELEEERNSLNQEATRLNSQKDKLNAMIDELNALVLALNQLAEKTNQGVVKFNDIADDHGEEFEEGNYELDSLGERINVFQFENKDKLVRVLAHELGHALGLGHVEDPDAIMYRLNDSSNLVLTSDDLVAVKARCKID